MDATEREAHEVRELIARLSEVLRSAGESGDAVEDLLVAMALDAGLDPSELGPAGRGLMARFTARSGAGGTSDPFQTYARQHPLPQALVARCVDVLTSAIANLASLKGSAAQDLIGASFARRPVAGEPGGASSLFQHRLRRH